MLKQMRKDSVKNGADQGKLNECQHKLTITKIALDRLRDTKPATGSLFLRLMMGKVNVRMWKKHEKLKFKQEYDKFKERTTILFTVLPLIQLFIWRSPLLFTVHQGWLLYYYTTLALRENILQVNGSQILDWWIYHHYISMTVCALMMNLTGFEAGDDFFHRKATLFLAFAAGQGVVMFVQNKYQAKRSYVRASLGKAQQHDPTSGETLMEKPSDLKLLVPLLFLVYALELYLGVDLAIYWYLSAKRLWQLLCVAILFVLLCVGNSITTARIIALKTSERVRVTRALSSTRLDLSPTAQGQSIPNTSAAMAT